MACQCIGFPCEHGTTIAEHDRQAGKRLPQVTRTIGVRLNADELAALRAVAGREDRDPRRQAARLVREGLERAGALSKPVIAEEGADGR